MGKYTFIPLLIFLFACSSEQKQLGIISNEHLINIKLSKIEDPKDVSIIDSLSYVRLEAKEDAYFGYVSKLRVYDGKIYILDNRYAKALFIYGLDGNHIKTFSDKGRGNNELTSITNFEIDYRNKNLMIMDNYGSKIMLTDLNGDSPEIIKSEIAVTNAVLSSDGTIIHAKSGYSFLGKDISNENYNIYICNKSGKVLKRGFQYNDNKNLTINSYFIIGSQSNGDIHFAPKLRDTIYDLTCDGFIPKYAIDYGENKHIGFKEAINYKTSDDFFSDVDNGKLCFLGTHVESSNYLYLQFGMLNNVVAQFYNKKNERSITINVPYDSKYSYLYTILCSDEQGYFYGAFNDIEECEFNEIFPKSSIDFDRENPVLFKYKPKI